MARVQYALSESAAGDIRNVQTFRDPSSSATFELSNQYDHAWLDARAAAAASSTSNAFCCVTASIEVTAQS